MMSDQSNAENEKIRFSPYEYKMLMQSFDYIHQNSGATNLDLPDHFLRFWAVPNFGINPHYRVNDTQLLVFMYILKVYHYSLIRSEDLLSSYEFIHLFYTFQVVLAATLHARYQNIPIQPFPILDPKASPPSPLNQPAELFRQFERITNKRVR